MYHASTCHLLFVPITAQRILKFKMPNSCLVLSNFLQPHGLWPPGSSVHGIWEWCSWDATNGVCVCVCVAQSCPTLCDPIDYRLLGSSVHGILQARILTSVGCHFLLQRIFPTQGWNPGLLNCKPILYHLSHQGSPSGVVYNSGAASKDWQRKGKCVWRMVRIGVFAIQNTRARGTEVGGVTGT